MDPILLDAVENVDVKIGETNDATGSAAGGTIMGKLNGLFEMLNGGTRTFSQDGTFIVPVGITKIKVYANGGGGGGGGAGVKGTSSGGAGGGGQLPRGGYRTEVTAV